MKYVKILGLLAVAATALMAFAGTASATTITSPTGTALATGSTIHAVSEENAVPGTTKVLLHNNIANIACEMEIVFTHDHTSATGTPTGEIHSLTFSNCNSPWTLKANHNPIPQPTTGRVEIHRTSGYDGTLTLSGTRITAIHHTIGVNCVYETSGTDAGTITGGSPATLDIIASIPRVGGSFLCGGANANWTGAIRTTNAYYIDS